LLEKTREDTIKKEHGANTSQHTHTHSHTHSILSHFVLKKHSPPRWLVGCVCWVGWVGWVGWLLAGGVGWLAGGWLAGWLVAGWLAGRLARAR